MPNSKKSAPKKASPTKAAGAKQKPKAAAKPMVAPKAKPTPKPAVELKAKPPAPVALPPRRPDAPRRPAPRREPIAPIDTGPVVPQKPQVDEEWQRNMRVMLAGQRQRLASVVQTTQAQMAEKSGDLADISDRASEGFEDELAVGLIAIEAAQLEDINAAIERIDNGSYGLCEDCGKAIPKKRLEVLPFARRCLSCEGEAERRVRVSQSQSDDEDIE